MASAMPQHPDAISPGYMVFIPLTCVMTSLSTAAVALRFASRRLSANLSWDDWAALGALVFAYGFLCTTVIVATVSRAGYNIATYTPQELEQYFKIVLANNCIYNASVVLSKTSILLFYRRIFVQKSFQRATLAVGFLVFGYLMATEFGLIFTTRPVQAQWKFWIKPSYSIAAPKFWLAMGITNIVLDVIILSMPQFQVWKLNRSLRRKVLVSLLFLLGGFVVVTSILRVIYLETVVLLDITETLTTAGIWTMVEMNTSVICACLPTLPSLMRYWYNGTLPDGRVRSSTSLLSLIERFRMRRSSREPMEASEIEVKPKQDTFSFSMSSYAMTVDSGAGADESRPSAPLQVNVRSDIDIEERAR